MYCSVFTVLIGLLIRERFGDVISAIFVTITLCVHLLLSIIDFTTPDRGKNSFI